MSQNQIKTAIRLHRNGKLEAAHGVYQGLIDKAPDDPRLYSLLGQLELQMGQSEAAIDNLRRAVGLAPDDPRIRLTLARGLAATGQHVEAIGIVHKVLVDDDASGDAWLTLAAVHRHRDDHVNELVALERATELLPDDVSSLIARANAEVANGYLDRAINTLKHAASQAPRNARVVNNLGTLYLRRNALDAAEAAFRDALAIAPDYSIALGNLATTLHRSNKLDAAKEAAERAVTLAPGNIHARTELATILMALGDLSGAEVGFKAVMEIAPADQLMLTGFAALRDKQGRSLEGLQMICDVVDAHPVAPDIRLIGASLAHRIGRREIVLKLLGPLLDEDGDPKQSLGQPILRRLRFLLGDINDASSDYRVALNHYTVANSILSPDYDAKKLYSSVDAIIAGFDTATQVQRIAPERQGKRIFIVGMPRSGTGLLDNMLLRHPAISTCGASPLLGRLLSDHPAFPARFRDLTAADLDQLGDRYCAAATSSSTTAWTIDKMPLNFSYLGALSLILPDALIIHCRRFPADTLLSCYFQNYSDPALAFSSDLDNLCHYWRNYNRMMRHWHELMPERIVEIHYEELVANPEGTMRPLLERLSIDWDWEVLNPAPTASAQSALSEPVHSRSVGRFARYRPFWGERNDFAALSQGAGPHDPRN